MIDAHHHLWDLSAVHYPWLMAQGETRFFGDPLPIQRDYLFEEFRSEAAPEGVQGSVHIQVGAQDAVKEARWVQRVADAFPNWPMTQVVFCDLTDERLEERLDEFAALPTVVGVRQIVGRAPGEDKQTGTNDLLANPRFAAGLQMVARRGLSFDLQLVPELMPQTARVLETVPELRVALCHAGSPHDRTAEGLASWSVQMQDLSRLPQVVCKLSGLGMFDHEWTTTAIQPIVAECLRQFGAERTMFGSNFPVDKLYSSYAAVVDAYRCLVPQANQKAVFETTARGFYNLA